MGGSMISARFGVEGDEAVERALKKIEDGLTAVEAGFDQLGDRSGVSADAVDKALGKVGAKLDETSKRAARMAEEVAAGGKKASDALEDAEKRGQRLGTIIGTTLVGGVTAAVTSLITLGVHGVKAISAMADLAEQTGLTVAQLQTLRVATQQGGGEVESLNKALLNATRTVGLAVNGNAALALSLDKLGVVYRNADGSARPMYATLQDLLDIITRMPTEQERAAAGVAIFGKQWVTLAPALKDGSEGLRRVNDELARTGSIVSADGAKQFEEYQKNLNRLRGEWDQLAITLGTKVYPWLTQVMALINQALAPVGPEVAGKRIAASLDEVERQVQEEVARRSAVVSRLQERGYRAGVPGSNRGDVNPIDEQVRELDKLQAKLNEVAKARAELNKQLQYDKTVREWSGREVDYPLGVPPGWKAPGTPPKDTSARGGGGGGADQTAKEYERAKAALDKYLESLARESDLSDESARERAGHTAQLKAEELARASVLKMTEDQIKAIGEEARARATAAFDAKQAQEDQRRAAEQAQREMERLAEREAQLLQQPLEEAARNTQGLMRDFFKDAMSGNLTSWKDFWGKAKDIARSYLAEMATLLVIRPIIQPLFSAAGLGGLMPGMGGGGAGSSSTTLGGMPYVPSSGGGLLGGGSLLGGGGLGGGGLFGNAFGFLNQPIFGGAASLAGSGDFIGAGLSAASGAPGLTWGGALGGLGSIGMGALGLAQGNMIGGISGILGGGLGILGAAMPALGFLGPIGMGIGLIGGILGSILKKKPKTPQAVSNISFGAGGISNALAMTRSARGGQLGQGTGQASDAFGQAFGELLGAYDLSMGPDATGGWILNSIGKNTGNQWIVGLGSYGSYTTLPGVDPTGKARDAASSISGIGSAEDAINILAGLVARQGAIEGSIQGLTSTQRTALSSTDLQSLEDIKDALDFSQVFDDLARGVDGVTQMEQALRDLDKQFDAAAAQAKKYGLDVNVVEDQRQAAINKLAGDVNEDYRRRGLGDTAEGALQVALEDLDKERATALKEAAELNKHVTGALVDINRIEQWYADQRVKIVEAAAEAEAAALQRYQDAIRGTQNITAAELAVRQLNEQFKALRTEAGAYGLDVGALEVARQEEINKLAGAMNDDARRRLLGRTPEGALQVALEDLDKARDAAIKNAQYLNTVVTGTLVDINQLEQAYAAERLRIIEQANEQASAALEDIWKRLTYGDLSGASPAAALSGAQASADALYAQAQAGSLTARSNLPAAIAELFEAQRNFTGNDAQYEALRQLWLGRLGSEMTANGNGPGPANGNGVDAGVLAQMQRQNDILAAALQSSLAESQELRREITRLLGRMAS